MMKCEKENNYCATRFPIIYCQKDFKDDRVAQSCHRYEERPGQDLLKFVSSKLSNTCEHNF